MAARFEIGPLTPTHADAGCGLTTAVGWSHRPDDWRLSLSVGHGLGAFDADGTLRGTLMWFPYGAAHGFVGMVVVDPSLHRGGIGRRLMDRAIAEAGDRTLLLVSTAAGRRLYEALGFRVIGSNAAHLGKGAAAPGDDDGVEPARADDLPGITALDAAALGYPRDALIAKLAAAGKVAVLRDGGRLSGFAICRRFGAGHVVGPLVAGGTGQAQRLLAYWLARRAGEMVRIDIPAEHADLAVWAIARGLPRGDESPIMVRGAAPQPAGRECRYALVSQATG